MKTCCTVTWAVVFRNLNTTCSPFAVQPAYCSWLCARPLQEVLGIQGEHKDLVPSVLESTFEGWRQPNSHTNHCWMLTVTSAEKDRDTSYRTPVTGRFPWASAFCGWDLKDDKQLTRWRKEGKAYQAEETPHAKALRSESMTSARDWKKGWSRG